MLGEVGGLHPSVVSVNLAIVFDWDKAVFWKAFKNCVFLMIQRCQTSMPNERRQLANEICTTHTAVAVVTG